MQTSLLCVLIGHEFNSPDARECRRPGCEFVKAISTDTSWQQQVFDSMVSSRGYVVVDMLGDLYRPLPEPSSTELCGRVLVGQGDDTSDPLCVLPKGHTELCSSAVHVEPLTGVAEEVIEAVTRAILTQNVRPGPKLTRFMARQRAVAAISAYDKFDGDWIRDLKDDNLRLENEVLNYKRQVVELCEKIQRDSAYQKVAGTCPACGSKGTLFLGEGGYVTCSWSECKDPSAADKLLHNDRASESMKERLSAIHSLSAPGAPSQ